MLSKYVAVRLVKHTWQADRGDTHIVEICFWTVDTDVIHNNTARRKHNQSCKIPIVFLRLTTFKKLCTLSNP